MTSLRALVRRCEAALSLADEPPQRAAAAFAIGVTISFSPLLGLQIVVAGLVAWATTLNRVLLFVGLCVNLPWLMAPYYAAATAAAAWAIGGEPPAELAARLSVVLGHSVFGRAFWHELAAVMRPLMLTFVVGSTVASLVFGAVAYRAGLAFVLARRARAGGH